MMPHVLVKSLSERNIIAQATTSTMVADPRIASFASPEDESHAWPQAAIVLARTRHARVSPNNQIAVTPYV